MAQQLNLKGKLIAIIGALLTIYHPTNAQHSVAVWQTFQSPISGTPTPVGKHTNGCLIGGLAVPFEGQGYQVVRREKYRYFAHPDMLAYLQRLGHKIHQAGLPAMLISDIAMPAGGRFATGHRSHQMGLDADIWFKMGKLPEESAQHSTGLAIPMANTETHKMTENWSAEQAILLELSASDDAVARIFVNPAIKIHLCQTVKKPRPWLRKIRPWHGHNSHFHVRLHCPAGAIHCQNQAPLPEGDGCDETLYAWLEPLPETKTPSEPEVIPPPPTLCQEVLDKYFPTDVEKNNKEENFPQKSEHSQ